MANWLDQVRAGVGSTIEQAGYALNLPELNISERFGVRTPQLVRQARAQESISPQTPTYGLQNPSPIDTSRKNPNAIYTSNPGSTGGGGRNGSGGGTTVSNPAPSGGGGQPSGAPPYAPNIVNQTVDYGGYTWKGNPGQGWSLSGGGDAMQSVPEAPQIDFDALIAPALQALDEAVAPAESAYQANVSQIGANRARNVGETQTYQTAAEKETGVQRERQTGLANSAIDEARRGFAELSQGLQARYGGTTGTGRFATEQAGTRTLKNIADIRNNLSNAVSTIDNKLSEVKELTRIKLTDIDDQATAQKQQAKSELDKALQQIRLQKGELQSRKTELAYQAMERYQALVADVNARNTAFKQQLALQQSEAENQLAMAREKALGMVEQFKFVNTKNGVVAVNPVTGTAEMVLPSIGGGRIQKEEEQPVIGGSLEDENQVLIGG